MMISYTHKFIFFHVAKVAGLSIREALIPYTREPDRFRIRRPPETLDGEPNPLYEMWKIKLLHAKAGDAIKEFSAGIYDSFYKFAFIRNPWDWQISMYHFILKETAHVSHQIVSSMADFEEYLEWVVSTKNPFARGATKFQKDMLTDSSGNIIVDFIGRYESLKQDFDHICQILNLKAALPQLNKTVHRDYRFYYNERTKRIVEEHFKDDIDLFGYTFDSPSDKSAII
ncbi:MAG: sulfotransferase family protein [Desulfobacteraceae bacterium]|nr:sulfotransferase family protein [Desulfobacteraceae bacterium]